MGVGVLPVKKLIKKMNNKTSTVDCACQNEGGEYYK